MKTRQAGFSVLEIILIVAVVGLVGAVAWMFVSNQKSAGQKSSTAEQSDTKTETKKPSKDDWLVYQPAGKEYSIHFADGWTVHKKSEQDQSLYTNGSLALQSGQRAVILDTPGTLSESMACTDGFVLDYLNGAYPKKYLTGNEEIMKSDSGADIYRTVEHGNMFDEKDKRVSYAYVMTTAKNYAMMSYTKCTDSADEHETVEDVVRSLQLK